MKRAQITPKMWQFTIAATIASLAIVAPSVQANTTEVLLRSGQTMPGDPKSKPLTLLSDFGIDSQQNVVATVRTQTYSVSAENGITNKEAFGGIYRLPLGQGPQLIDSTINIESGLPSGGASFNTTYRSPSISLGKVAYIQSLQKIKSPLINDFKFGTPGSVTTFLQSVLPEIASERSLATVNGKVFLLTEGRVATVQSGITKYENGQLQLVVKGDDPVITAGDKPPLSIGDNSFLVRASSTTVVFARTVSLTNGGATLQVFELPNGGKLRKIYEIPTLNFCGLSASRSNVVVCADNRIFTRRGNSPQFTQIKSPLSIALQPSISGEAVVFVGQEFDARGQKRRQALYIDKLGQPQRVLVKAAESLTEAIDLSTTGQSINGSAVVYRYTKPDGSFELRRLKLQ